MKNKIVIVAAVSENNVIGDKGGLIWHLKKDLAWFKQQTTGKHIVMGRKSYEDVLKYSKGNPLPNRVNIVLTSKEELNPGFIVEHDIQDIIDKEYDTDLMVIGGYGIFKTFIPLADELILTEIKKTYQGDTVFPEWDKSHFEEYSRQSEEENGIYFDFVKYKRIKY